MYECNLNFQPGDALGHINAETVTLTWLVGNEPLRSQHKVYTIAGNLNSGNNFHTVIDLSCNAAKGLTKYDKDEIYRRLWNRFATLDIRRIDSIDNNDKLTYWGTGAEYTYNISDVLQRKTARCGTWSLLFREACALQGVNVGEVGIYAIQQSNIYYYTFHQKGPFQGGSNLPSSLFSDHVVNKYNGCYYDVTNGTGPYQSIVSYLIDNIQIEKHLILGYDALSNPIVSKAYVDERILLTADNYDDYVFWEE